MAQQIIETPGSVFGRLGAGLGKGLAEQLPKEVERSRLSSGLKNFEQESANLNPMQQLARLSAIPGITPQMIQSFGELGRQQLRGQALQSANAPQTQPSPFPIAKTSGEGIARGEAPTLTKEETFAKAQEGYIPMTEDEKLTEAGRRYNENPALFNNEPQRALDFVDKQDQTNQAIAAAQQQKHQNLTTIQDNVVNRLKAHSERLGAQLVPANVYSKIEDKAIQATKPKKDGGNGLTEQEAMKKYGKELDDIARDYQAIDTLGNWGIVGKKASTTLNSMRALQQKFEKNNDTENFADSLIAKNKLSPSMAYSIAEPVSRVPELNSELLRLKPLKKEIFGERANIHFPLVNKEKQAEETLKIAQKLAVLLGKKGSPLAVAHELDRLNYDPAIWMKYLTDNRKDLDLSESQGRQLDKTDSLTGTLNDWWLSSWSGIEGNK